MTKCYQETNVENINSDMWHYLATMTNNKTNEIIHSLANAPAAMLYNEFLLSSPNNYIARGGINVIHEWWGQLQVYQLRQVIYIVQDHRCTGHGLSSLHTQHMDRYR